MSRSPVRFLVIGLLGVLIVVLALTNVLPRIGSSNYWWVVLAFVVIAVGAKLYWRSTTGSWQNPRSRRGPR
jgi:hypothetical protein